MDFKITWQKVYSVILVVSNLEIQEMNVLLWPEQFEKESNDILMVYCFEKHFDAYHQFHFLIKGKEWTILNK